MYLIDTCIFLEIFLNGPKSTVAKKLLSSVPFKEIYVTDISVHTIGVILYKHNLHDIYIHFLNDLFVKNEVWRIQLGVDISDKVVQVAKKYNLEYIDAYQYAAAEMYDLTLVSFNEKFDKTDRGRKEP
jgi:uncharacterized protein